jgi:hypothetical protein
MLKEKLIYCFSGYKEFLLLLVTPEDTSLEIPAFESRLKCRLLGTIKAMLWFLISVALGIVISKL